MFIPSVTPMSLCLIVLTLLVLAWLFSHMLQIPNSTIFTLSVDAAPFRPIYSGACNPGTALRLCPTPPPRTTVLVLLDGFEWEELSPHQWQKGCSHKGGLGFFMSLFISVDAAASPRKLNSTCTLNARRTLSFHFHSELEIEEQMPRLFFAWTLPSNMLLDFLYWPHVTTFGAVRVFSLACR